VRQALLPALVCCVTVAGCAATPQPVVATTPIPATDALYQPSKVAPGRLEYAPDRTTFAPILTEKFPYPTQAEAKDAYRRRLASGPENLSAGSIWLFGCKPGALDAQTARVVRYRGPVVHCATDFLDGSGLIKSRETANFYYVDTVWRMQVVHPPRSPVPWRAHESSPHDMWWWIPWRSRYE